MRSKARNSSRKSEKNPRGKSHSRSEEKVTIGVYVSRNLVERARNHCLNLSRITEQALSSILDYLETQNTEIASNESSAFLNRRSFLKESRMPRAGFEPATTRSSAERSPRLSYLGTVFHAFWMTSVYLSA
jgi:post-segregation antitoxin (ccd killing protein)